MLKQPLKGTVFNIHVGFCKYIWSRKLIHEAKLYFFLKTHTNGVFSDGDGTKKLVASKLKITGNTLSKYIKNLIKLGWLHYNPVKRKYYIIALTTVLNKLCLQGKLIVKAPLKCFKDFDAFIASILITEKLGAMEYMKNKKEKNGDAVLRNLPGTDKVLSRSSFFHVPEYLKLGTKGIMKLLSCSYGKAQALKIRASKINLIKITKHREPLKGDIAFTPGEISFVNKTLPEEDLGRVKTGRYYMYPKKGMKIPCGSYIYKELCDEIHSSITLVRMNKNFYRKIKPFYRLRGENSSQKVSEF